MSDLGNVGPLLELLILGLKNVSLATSCQNRQIWDVLFQVS
jgi:hypothetical protein